MWRITKIIAITSYLYHDLIRKFRDNELSPQVLYKLNLAQPKDGENVKFHMKHEKCAFEIFRSLLV